MDHLSRLLKVPVIAAEGGNSYADIFTAIDRTFKDDFFFGDPKEDELDKREEEFSSKDGSPRKDINKVPWRGGPVKESSKKQGIVFLAPLIAWLAANPMVVATLIGSIPVIISSMKSSGSDDKETVANLVEQQTGNKELGDKLRKHLPDQGAGAALQQVAQAVGQKAAAIRASQPRLWHQTEELTKQAADEVKIDIPEPPDAPPQVAKILQDWGEISSQFEAIKKVYKGLEEKEKGLREQVGDQFKQANTTVLRVNDLLYEYKESVSDRIPYGQVWPIALEKVNKQTRSLLEKIAAEMASPSTRRILKVRPSGKKASKLFTAGVWSYLKNLVSKLLGRLNHSVDILQKALAEEKGQPKQSSRFFTWDVDDEIYSFNTEKRGRIADIVSSDEFTCKQAFRVSWEDGSNSTIDFDHLNKATRLGEVVKVSSFDDWLFYTLGE